MNESNEIEFEKLIESLTTSGSLELNVSHMKSLKSICRKSDDNIDRVFRQLFVQLNQNHSQIRVSTLLIINELFLRSHRFRQLLTQNLYELFELCLEINCGRKLPKPKSFANQLKLKSIEFIHNWYREFGEGYQELRNAVLYLTDNKIVDFNHRTVVSECQRKRLESEENVKKNIIKAKVEKAVIELHEIQTEVNCLLTQINSCFDLLMPKMTSTEDSISDNTFDRIKHLTHFSVDIFVNPLTEVSLNEDTKAIIENMKDIDLQLSRISTFKLKRLLHIMSKGYDLCEKELKTAIDLKSEIENVKQKFLELKIITKEDLNQNLIEIANNESDSSDDDFEEVPEKEGLELIIAAQKRLEYGLQPLPKASTSSDSSPDRSLSSQTANQMQCNAILPSGKLCPRKDRIKCPFHGLIIDRDMNGMPLSAKHREEEELKKANALPEWQDPKLLRELKAAVGIDLTVGKRKRRKYPGLQDVKQLENTARKRLERKVFKKAVRERVDRDLNSIDEKNHSQYEDQWNYSLQS